MAKTTTGLFIEDFVDGEFVYGEGGVGSLTVDLGSFVSFSASDISEEPQIDIGHNGGTGTATVTGAGSVAEILSNGNSTDSGRLFLGFGAGSSGTLNVLAGGTFQLIDDTGAAGSDATGGGEIFVVGDSGGQGTLNVDAGTVTTRGTGVYFTVGNSGGTGTATFQNGSALTVEAATSSSDDYIGINLGRNDGATGSNGTMTFDASTGTITGLGDTEVYMNVGRDGDGTFNLNNGSTFTITGADSQYTGMAVGQDNSSSGTVNVNNSTLSIDAPNQEQYLLAGRDSGTGTINLDNGTLNLNGATGASVTLGNAGTGTLSADNGSVLNFSSGSQTGINVGVDFDNVAAGNGTLELLNGSTLNVTGGTGARFNSNVGVGGTGTFSVSASTVNASVDGEIYVGVGREGGDGTFNVLANSAVNLTTASAAFTGIQIGRDDANSSGEMNITDSTVTITNNGGATYSQLGRDDGTGFLNLDDGTLAFIATTSSSILAGSDGGIANIDLANGSLFEFNSDHESNFNFGRTGGASAKIDLDMSTIRFMATGIGLVPGETYVKSAGGNIGRDGSTGTVTLTNGSLFDIDSASEAYINVGREVGGNGTFNLTGSTLNVETSSTTQGAYLNVGRDGATGQLNADAGTINVTSTGDFATIRLGMDFGTPGGDGTAVLENGTTVSITGDTARLSVGYTANSSGDLQVRSGSTVAITDTGTGTEGSAFSVGHNPGTTSATALIDGAGSTVSGADYTIVGYYDPIGGVPGTGNGHLTIQSNGSLSANSVVIGDGGTLNLGDSSITTATSGTVFGQPTGMYVTGGDMRVLSGGTANISGNLAFINSASLIIEVAGDGSSSGFINHSAGLVSDDGTFDFTLDSSGYSFAAGDQYLLLTTTGTADFSTATGITVTGQNSQFAHYTYGDGNEQNVFFTALNNGDGTGSRTFNFTDYSAAALDFVYDTDGGRGLAENSATASTTDITGGVVYNIDKVVGTNENDTITLNGSGATVEVDTGAGADTINGGLGKDILNGGAGMDIINGGADDDLIIDDNSGAATEIDQNDGGTGIDTYQATAINWAADSEFNLMTGFQTVLGGIQRDTFTDIENLTIAGSASIVGDNMSNRLEASDTQGAADNVLNGNGGIDALVGNGGNDWLFGGLLGDTLTGGADKDYFVFDASQNNNADVVTDYNAADDVVYFGGTASQITPTVVGGDVMVNGVKLTGAAGGNVKIITQLSSAVLGESGQNIRTVLAGTEADLAGYGAFVSTIHDVNGDEAFNKDINVYTTDGLDYRLVENDDGSSLLINLDQTNTNGWSQITTTKDTAGEITNVVTNLDTGSFFSKFFDLAGAQPWLTSTTGKNAANMTDYQDITYDDMSRIFTDYDQDGTIPWTTALTNYNAAGQQVFRRVNFDDGRFEVTYEDFDSSQDWNTKIDTYTDGVNRDFVNFYNDDGTRKTVDFDQDTSQLWSTKEIFYDAGGAATSFIEYNDDGTRRSKVFDPDDAANWNEILIVYDAAGAQDFRRDDYDLGENGLISYLVREFDNENTEVWDTRFREYDVDDNLLNEYFI